MVTAQRRQELINQAVEALVAMQVERYAVDIPEMDKEDAATVVVDLVLRELEPERTEKVRANLAARIYLADPERPGVQVAFCQQSREVQDRYLRMARAAEDDFRRRASRRRS